jgi:hypothetical protein
VFLSAGGGAQLLEQLFEQTRASPASIWAAGTTLKQERARMCSNKITEAVAGGLQPLNRDARFMPIELHKISPRSWSVTGSRLLREHNHASTLVTQALVSWTLTKTVTLLLTQDKQ